MNVETLLARLDGVIQPGPGRWRARCPAHASKGRTLGIREGDDGRILLHCFAGCEVNAVLGAVGLTMNDLFPAPLRNTHRDSGAFVALRRIFGADDIIDAMRAEILLVQISAATLARGDPLSAGAHARLRLAASRLHSALDASEPAHRRPHA